MLEKRKGWVELALVLALCFTCLNFIIVEQNGRSYDQFALRHLAVTIPVNSGSTISGVATYTIASPSKASYEVTCADTGGCRLYFGETGDLKAGQITGFTNVSSNSIVLTELTDVINLSASTVTLGLEDTIQLKRTNGKWVQNYLGNN